MFSKLVPLIAMSLIISSATARAALTFKIGRPEGISHLALIKEYQSFTSVVLQDAGYDAVFEDIPLKRMMEAVNKGQLDGAIFDNKLDFQDRPNIVSVSFPIIVLSEYIFYRKDQVDFNIQHLEKYRGAFVLNDYGMKKKAEQGKYNYTTTGTTLQNLKLLLAGRIDYVVSAEQVGKENLKILNVQDKIAISAAPIITNAFYFSLNKKYKNELVKIEASFRKHLPRNLDAYPTIKNNLNSRLKP